MTTTTPTERCQCESQATDHTHNRASQDADQQILQADRKLRRTVLIACVACIGVGAALIHWGIPWAVAYLAQLEPETSLRILQLTVSLVFLGLLPIAWYLWSCGMRAVSFQQMPPPGMKVIKTVKVLTGDSAVARGKALIVLAALIATISLAGGILFPLRLARIMPPPGTEDVPSRQSGRMDTNPEAPSPATAEPSSQRP